MNFKQDFNSSMILKIDVISNFRFKNDIVFTNINKIVLLIFDNSFRNIFLTELKTYV